MPIMRISDPTFEEKRSHDNRVFVRFRVNEHPTRAGSTHSRATRARASFARPTPSFTGNDVTLELVRPKSRAELTTALDCFIECANLGLRSWGGVEGSPATGGACFATASSPVRASGNAKDRMARSCLVIDELWQGPGVVSSRNTRIDIWFVNFDGWHRGCVLKGCCA